MRSFRRVLVVSPYGIGDMLFLTPVLRALRLVGSVEKVDLLTGSRTEQVIRPNPHVDEIFPVDKDLFHRQGFLKTAQDVFRLGKRLRRNRYDLLIDASMRDEYSFLAQFFLGIPVRAGFAYRRRGFFLTHRLPLPNGFEGRHVVDYYCQIAEDIGIPVRDRFLEFYLTDEARAEAACVVEEKRIPFQKYAVVCLGGGESWGKDARLKHWSAGFFSELVRQLKKRLDFDGVILVGSQGEKYLAGEWAKTNKTPCADLVGEVSLSVAAALIEKSALFIGNDGGLVHLSHALRVPLIAFYGPVDPAVYGPYPPSLDAVAVYHKNLDCRPCYRNFRYRASCAGAECLQALSPGEVLDTLESLGFFQRYLCVS
jgi:lipopolysaccharide heptosyltransferase II